MNGSGAVCSQPEILPPLEGWKSSHLFLEPEYRERSKTLLSSAIRIPTESYDDMSLNVTSDPRFDVFKRFHAYLSKSFPMTWDYVEKVNSYGLLYTIEGADPTLKPMVFMAHQDVVPANPETLDQWDYPPYEGHFDGEWIFGRGAGDTKNSLVAILEATEALLEQQWQPKRTLILSFGFDEEITGYRGALTLADRLFDTYGPSGIEFILDEGLPAINSIYGSSYAMVGVTEKGRLDVKISLGTPGGHSSMPPDHTGIGIISELVTRLERDKIPASLPMGEKGVLLSSYSCVGCFARSIDPDVKAILTSLEKESSRKQLLNLLEESPLTRATIKTTQAIDIISGGVKVNALPEQVEVVLDHRINLDSSIGELMDRLSKHALDLSNLFNLSVSVDGEILAQGDGGMLNVEILSGALEPAPISPFSANDSTWNLIGGTTRHIFESVLDYEAVHLAPLVVVGNTDTAHYWELSSRIYRFVPMRSDDVVGFHTVNEKIRLSGHLSSVMWYYEFILNSGQ